MFEAGGVLLEYQRVAHTGITIDFSKIKEAISELGCRADVATKILIELKQSNFESTITYSKIKDAMKALDCTAEEAIKVLFSLQKVWSRGIDFPLSEIKTMKEIIGDKGINEDLNQLGEALKLAFEKQKYKEGDITKEEWQYFLINKYSIEHLNITQYSKLSPPVEQNKDKNDYDIVADLKKNEGNSAS